MFNIISFWKNADTIKTNITTYPIGDYHQKIEQ